MVGCWLWMRLLTEEEEKKGGGKEGKAREWMSNRERRVKYKYVHIHGRMRFMGVRAQAAWRE